MENRQRKRSLWVLIVLGMMLLQGFLPAVPASSTDGNAATPRDASENFSLMSIPFSPAFNDATWSPDGTNCVIAANYGQVLRYNATLRSWYNISVYNGASTHYLAVAMAPNGTSLITGNGGQTLAVSPANNKYTVDTNGVNFQDAEFSPDGNFAYLVGPAGNIVQYNSSDRTTFPLDNTTIPDYNMTLFPSITFTRIAWRPGGDYALLMGNDGSTRYIYKFNSTNITDISTKFGTGFIGYDLAWSPDGSKAVVVGSAATVRIFNAAAETVETINSQYSGALYACTWRNNTAAYVVQMDAGNYPIIEIYNGAVDLVETKTYPYSSTTQHIDFNPQGTEGFFFINGNYVFHFPNLPPRQPYISSARAYFEVVGGASTGAFFVNFNDIMEPEFNRYEVHVSNTSYFTPSPATNYTNLTMNAGEPGYGSPYNYSVKGLAMNSTYYVKVRAVDNYGAYADSNEITVTTPATLKVAKVVPRLYAITPNTVTLTWNTTTEPYFSRLTVHISNVSASFIPDDANQVWSSFSSTQNVSGNMPVQPMTTYWFIVRITNGYGLVGDSDPFQVNTPDVGTPVLSVDLEQIKDTSAYLQWSWQTYGTFRFFNVFVSENQFNLFDSYVRNETNVATKSYTVNGLKPSTKYYAAVKVGFTYTTTQEKTSAIINFTTKGEMPLNKPNATLSSVTINSAYVTFQYEPTTGESFKNYQIYLSKDQASISTMTSPNYTTTSNSYSITDLSMDTTYYIIVRVNALSGKSANSTVITFKTLAQERPPTPAVSMSEIKDNSGHTRAYHILIPFIRTWSPSNSDKIASYAVYYGTTAGFTINTNAEYVTTITQQTTGSSGICNLSNYPFNDRLVDGNTYYFRVRTLSNQGIYSFDSNELSVKYVVYSPPSSVSMSSISDSSIGDTYVTIKWNPSTATDFKHYIIEYKRSADKTYTEYLKVTTKSATSLKVEGLEPDTAYNFRVTVEDQSGLKSTASSAVSASTKENLMYSAFFGKEAFCLPLILFIVGVGILGGVAKKSKKGALIGAPIVAGFFILFMMTLIQVGGATITPTQKYQMFFLIILITVLISVAWAMYAISHAGYRNVYPVILATPIVGSLFMEGFVFLLAPSLFNVPFFGLKAGMFIFVFGIIVTLIIIGLTAARAGQRVAANKLRASRMAKEERERKTKHINDMLPKLEKRILALEGYKLPFINTGPVGQMLLDAQREHKEENLEGAYEHVENCDAAVREMEMKVSDHMQKGNRVIDTLPRLDARLSKIDAGGYKGISAIAAREMLGDAKKALDVRKNVEAVQKLDAAEKETADLEIKMAEAIKKSDEVAAKLPDLIDRITKVEAIPKHPSTKPCRDAVDATKAALDSRDISGAEKAIDRAEKNVIELESNAKDKTTQVNDLKGRLAKISGALEDLKNWSERDAFRQLGIDAKKVDPALAADGKKFESGGINTITTKLQAAQQGLDNDDLTASRDAALKAERAIEQFTNFKNDWQAKAGHIGSLASQISAAAKWATLDSARFSKVVDEIKSAIACNDMPTAHNQLSQLQGEVSGFDANYRPELTVIVSDVEYQKDKYENFQFSVRNDGRAGAFNIVIYMDAPAKFGMDERGDVKIPKLQAGETKDCKINLSFDKEGDVPFKLTIEYIDHNGRKMPQSGNKYVARVVREKAVTSKSNAPAKEKLVIRGKPILSGGFMNMKLAVVNHSGIALLDALALITYKRKVLRFDHLFPDAYKYSIGDENREDVITFGTLDPKRDQEVALDIFFHPYICTETTVEIELRYKDMEGNRHSIPGDPVKFQCYCPTFEAVETPNPAMVIGLLESSDLKDERRDIVPAGISMRKAFDILKSSLSKSNMKFVAEEITSKSPFDGWVLFFGEELLPSGQKIRYAIRGYLIENSAPGTDVDVGGAIILKVAGGMRTKLTALLSTVLQNYAVLLEKETNAKRPQVNIYQTNIIDSIINKSSIGIGGEGGQGAPAQGATTIKGSVVSRSDISGPVSVEDSAVSRTKLGGGDLPALPSATDPGKQKQLNKYYQQYHRFKFNDGVIDEDERGILDSLLEMSTLQKDEIDAIEARVDAEYVQQSGGAFVEENAPAPAPRSAQSKPAKPKQQSEGKIKCKACGADNPVGYATCTNCGDLLI